MRGSYFKNAISFLIVCGLAISMPGLVNAEILTVPGQFSTIQDAVDAAKDGDVVELSIGVFRGQGNRDIRLNGKAITIRGAFGAEFSVIDAEGTPQVPYRGFIFDSGETVDTVIEGLTICGGATLPGAIADPFNGGGLFFVNSSATVRNCVIEDNECGCWGGGVYVSGELASPVIENCDISGNLSGDDGGAVFVWNGGSVTLVNCNMNNNDGTVTGGAYTEFSGNLHTRSRIINCNIIGNEAFIGSGIYAFNTDIVNSIVWDNFGANSQVDGNFNAATISYSIVQGGFFNGEGIINANPIFMNASAGDYRLHPGSPAIDAANNEWIPENIITDMVGNNRFHDDPGMANSGVAAGQSGVADLGPIEFQGRTVNRFSKAFGN